MGELKFLKADDHCRWARNERFGKAVHRAPSAPAAGWHYVREPVARHQQPRSEHLSLTLRLLVGTRPAPPSPIRVDRNGSRSGGIRVQEPVPDLMPDCEATKTNVAFEIGDLAVVQDHQVVTGPESTENPRVASVLDLL